MSTDQPTRNEVCITPGGTEKLHLLGCDQQELRRWLAAHSHAPYRAQQIMAWIYEKRVGEFEAMTNLSKPLRVWLSERATIYSAVMLRQTVSQDGTRKLLLAWPDETATETVWIPAEERNTVCLSTQVGCPVGCAFCASGLDGMQRNLTAGEIVEQAAWVARIIGEQTPAAVSPSRLSNIVIMGIGEPLANYHELVKALRILNAPWGLGIGARRITVSTIGLPKQIRRLAGESLQVNLALSLHAPSDGLREKLVPWAKRAPIEQLIDACQYYFKTTGREVTLEYVLLEGVNMQARHADGLARIAKRLRANVNLLRYNPVPGLSYRRPSAEAAFEFQRRLRESGVNAHVRTSRGQDVNAACGQLRRAARDD